jgi:hypothetical protein
MEAVHHVSEDLLTSLPRLFQRNETNLTQHDSTIAPEARVVRSHAARLDPQHEAGQSVVVELKRFALRLSLFAGEQRRSAGQLTTVNFRNLANTWTASLWNSSGQTLWSSTLTSATTAVSMPAPPSNGSYSIVFDPQFTGGSFQYEPGIVPASALTVNGSAITVYGGGPGNLDGGPVAKATFSGTAGQKLTLTVAATQGFFYGLNIYYQTSSGQTCLGGCGTGSSGGTCAIALPTLPVTATYIVYVQYASSYYSTTTMSLSTTSKASGCVGNIG